MSSPCPSSPHPVKCENDFKFVSAAEGNDSNDLIVSWHNQILHRSPTPSPQERAALMKNALERKKAAMSLLVSAQRDIETQASFMIEERGLDETIRFQNTHYNIGDCYTAVGQFIVAVSRLTIASVKK